MSWAAFIAAGVGHWAKRAAAGLGIGVITYVGLEALQTQLATMVTQSIGGLTSDIYAIVAMAGFVDALQIGLSAIGVVVSMHAVQRLGLL